MYNFQFDDSAILGTTTDNVVVWGSEQESVKSWQIGVQEAIGILQACQKTPLGLTRNLSVAKLEFLDDVEGKLQQIVKAAEEDKRQFWRDFQLKPFSYGLSQWEMHSCPDPLIHWAANHCRERLSDPVAVLALTNCMAAGYPCIDVS